MGVSFDPALRIAGYRPKLMRDLLIHISGHDQEWAIMKDKTFRRARDVAILFEEAVDRNLITWGIDEERETPRQDSPGWVLTAGGHAVAGGSAMKRTPYAKAKQVLDELLQRAVAMNANPEAGESVAKIWLFGSMLRQEPTVGDIDVVITIERRHEVPHSVYENRANSIVRRYDLPRPSWEIVPSPIRVVTKFLLFGYRRPALLSGSVQADLATLIKMHVPCKLIFDKARGGIVDDPVLPHHPSSTKRSADVKPKRVLPDLVPAPLRLMHASWLAGYEDWGEVAPTPEDERWDHLRDHLFYPAVHIVSGGPDGQDPNGSVAASPTTVWRPALAQTALNGRGRTLLIHEGRFAAVLSRTLEISDSAIVLRARFDASERRSGSRATDASVLADLSTVAATLLAADCERALRRQLEAGVAPSVQIKLADDAATQGLAALTDLALRDGCVRCLPDDWQGAANPVTVAVEKTKPSVPRMISDVEVRMIAAQRRERGIARRAKDAERTQSNSAAAAEVAPSGTARRAGQPVRSRLPAHPVLLPPRTLSWHNNTRRLADLYRQIGRADLSPKSKCVRGWLSDISQGIDQRVLVNVVQTLRTYQLRSPARKMMVAVNIGRGRRGKLMVYPHYFEVHPDGIADQYNLLRCARRSEGVEDNFLTIDQPIDLKPGVPDSAEAANRHIIAQHMLWIIDGMVATIADALRPHALIATALQLSRGDEIENEGSYESRAPILNWSLLDRFAAAEQADRQRVVDALAPSAMTAEEFIRIVHGLVSEASALRERPRLEHLQHVLRKQYSLRIPQVDLSDLLVRCRRHHAAAWEQSFGVGSANPICPSRRDDVADRHEDAVPSWKLSVA